jgi:hypothetical protein
VSITARSGSNEYHASGYNYLRIRREFGTLWPEPGLRSRKREWRIAQSGSFLPARGGFNGQAITDKLKKLGAEIAPSNDEKLLCFRDPNGFIVELKSGV